MASQQHVLAETTALRVQMGALSEQNAVLSAENRLLKQQVAFLQSMLQGAAPPVAPAACGGAGNAPPASPSAPAPPPALLPSPPPATLPAPPGGLSTARFAAGSDTPAAMATDDDAPVQQMFLFGH